MNLSELFSLDGRAFYISASFGVFALFIAVEVAMVRLRTKRVRAETREELIARRLRSK
jgi:heme exporter protein CcmD